MKYTYSCVRDGMITVEANSEEEAFALAEKLAREQGVDAENKWIVEDLVDEE